MNVFVKAFVSGNLGDDLFIKILCDRYKKHKFYISGEKKYKNFFENIDNLVYISNDLLIYKCIFKFINKFQYTFKLDVVPMYDYIDKLLIRKCKLNVLIGGSLFQEPINRKHKINRRTIWNENYMHRLHIIGCNFGPYRTDEFYNMYKDTFRKVASVCFRDKYSYKLFKDLENTRYATDVIFNLPNNKLKNEDYYVISVIDVYKDKLCKDIKLEEKYVKKLVAIINNITALNKKVILISFCDSQLDDKVINHIIKKIKNEKLISRYPYKGFNLDEILDIIKNCNGIIATRFHAMILGLLYKKPVLPIIYDIKMENVLTDMNFNDYYISIKDIENIDMNLVNESLKTVSSINIDKICELSQEQFYSLDKVLK